MIHIEENIEMSKKVFKRLVFLTVLLLGITVFGAYFGANHSEWGWMYIGLGLSLLMALGWLSWYRSKSVHSITRNDHQIELQLKATKIEGTLKEPCSRMQVAGKDLLLIPLNNHIYYVTYSEERANYLGVDEN